MKPEKLTGRNIMFTEPMDGYSLNIGLITAARHNFVIDTGLGGGSVAPVLTYLAGDAKPFVVVNTHFHWDHVWGNWLFENSLIISHMGCRERIEKYWERDLERFAGYADGEIRKCLPNAVFEERIYFPDDGVNIFYSPGHTPDCISVYDESDKVLYAGDNIGDTVEEIIPYINTDAETLAKTLEIYKKLDFGLCVSGHNRPQGRDIAARMEAALEVCWRKQLAEHGAPEVL